MRPSEVRELIKFRPVEWDRTNRRLRRSLNIDDLRTAARQALPRSVFDYIDGGADEEITLAENRAGFQSWRFTPTALQKVEEVDLSVEVLGRRLSAPLGLCPTGYTRMIHAGGELAVARASAPFHIPYALSTVGTTTIEELAAVNHEELWFQLYVLRDKAHSRSLVERAAAAGFRVLEVAVDTAVSGQHERDIRNGLTIPPALSFRAFADMIAHVGYWSTLLRAPALRFASFQDLKMGEVSASHFAAKLFNPNVTWDDLAEIRSWWQGPMLLKGQLSSEDARRAVQLGIDGVHLSNHGGRQLDRSLPTAYQISPVREVLGESATLVVDSGVRHGADIATAVMLGADLAGIGRPYLYALAAGGQRGVVHVIRTLVSQLRRTLQLLGVASINDLRANGKRFLCGQGLVQRTDAIEFP